MLEIRPDSSEALQLVGNIAAQTGRALEAAELLSRAVEVDPGRAAAYNDLGIALHALARHDSALQAYDRAIALDPDFAEAYVNRGDALADLQRHEAALECYSRAIALKPQVSHFHINRGNALSALKRHDAALESYDRAITLNPGYAEAYYNRGETLRELNRPEAALESFGRALRLKPDHEDLYGLWVHTKMTVCDWNGIEGDFSVLVDRIVRHERASPPFPLLAMPVSASLQRKAAEIWVEARHPASDALPVIPRRPRRDRIRVGYFSADFHDHATSHLMAELFERHDKSRFELTAFSFGPDRQDAMRRRVCAAFEQFVDARTMSDMEVAMQARDRGLDIALDLKGFCQDSRTGIFALRAAPVQVNYLGYPGTMGAGYIDYLIADATLVPEQHRQHYSEKIVYLPNCYQANDTRRPISDKAVSRQEMGLPQAGFVYCCFNNNFKIVPAMFDCWMRILRRVEGSVLWLLEDNARAVENLRKEAKARGVGPDRLVFARRLPLPEHLARHRLADLFLDTLPCNAHTTASDALWAGLPVLTCLGDTFSGRVAASLLSAILLPELVTQTAGDYERLAIDLAVNPGRLADFRHRLASNRLTAPLFDVQRFTRDIEAAYVAMHERYLANLAPAHLHVQAESGADTPT
ncbi:MAG: tetratricopeptide repeat protein [Proteobacteria bacterium]|nr:tetratricopeptide repeat protein [Pseudomonadota bacterium]